MDPELVEVDSFRVHAEAATAKALLEARGIAAVLVHAHSGDLFAGVLGEVRLQVAAGDAARAKELLAGLRRGAAERAREDDGVERCLACGEPLAAGAVECAACGFTFAGEEVHHHANGPVPDSLLAQSVSPLDSQRFALRPGDVERYLDWCEAQGLGVRGWEVWQLGALGHTVRERVERGEAEVLRRVARFLAKGSAGELLVSPDVVAGEVPRDGEEAEEAD